MGGGRERPDLERVLQHFSEDVIFTSPHARQLLDGCNGVVRGKHGLRRYWHEGLRQIADLRFELLGDYVGTTTIVIDYRNQRGGLASEGWSSRASRSSKDTGPTSRARHITARARPDHPT